MNIKNNRFLNEQYFYTKQNINTSTINDITKKNIINNNENVLNVKGYSYKTYLGNNYKPQIVYVENNPYKKQDNRTPNNTNNIYKHINQYSTDANKTHVKNTYYNYNNDVFLLISMTPLTPMVHTIQPRVIVYIMLLILIIILKRMSIQVIPPTRLQDIAITIMNTM